MNSQSSYQVCLISVNNFLHKGSMLLQTSLANNNDLLLYIHCIKSGFDNWSQTSASFQQGVPIANKIGRIDGILPSKDSAIFRISYRTRGVQPGGYEYFFLQKFHRDLLKV